MAGFYDQGYYTTFGDPAYPVGYDLAAAGSRPMIAAADPYPYGAVLPAPRAAPVMQRYTDLGYTLDPVYIGPSPAPAAYYPSGPPVRGPAPPSGPWTVQQPAVVAGPVQAVLVGSAAPSKASGRYVTSRDVVTSDSPDDVVQYPTRKEKTVMWREVSIKRMDPVAQTSSAAATTSATTAAYSAGPTRLPTVPLPRGYQLAPAPQYGYYRDVMPSYPMPLGYVLQPGYLPY
jgi:hypothetical protein